MAQAKTIAIGCIAAVLLAGVIIACAVGGIFWLGMLGEAEKAEQKGLEFGSSTDQRGCQTEALKRLRAAIRGVDLIKRREAQLFVNGCFQTCRGTSAFCLDAPKEDTFSTVQEWSEQQCRREGFGSDDACQDVFKEVADACFGKIKRK